MEDERIQCYVQRVNLFSMGLIMYINVGRLLSSELLQLIFFCEH